MPRHIRQSMKCIKLSLRLPRHPMECLKYARQRVIKLREKYLFWGSNLIKHVYPRQIFM